jgi:hypothetical protein
MRRAIALIVALFALACVEFTEPELLVLPETLALRSAGDRACGRGLLHQCGIYAREGRSEGHGLTLQALLDAEHLLIERPQSAARERAQAVGTRGAEVPAAHDHLRVVRDEHRQRLAQYAQVAERLDTELAHHDAVIYWRVTLDYGRRVSEALVAWSDAAEAALHAAGRDGAQGAFAEALRATTAEAPTTR